MLAALVFAESQPAQAQTETILHSFDNNGTDGAWPYAGLVMDKKGNLYGTTNGGGAYYNGTVFELTPTKEGWTETILHSFDYNGTDGTWPWAGLIMDKEGNLYGTTERGGADWSGCYGVGCGTVFELTPSGTETILHSFDQNGTEGHWPYAGVVFDKKGNLYGTTVYGGANGAGTVFELTPTKEGWTETILHSFEYNYNGTDGTWPFAGLVFDKKGNLYGTTYEGGAYNYGTVFELTPTKEGWTETILYSFNPWNGTDGQWPVAGLIFDKEGNLYGTTNGGGAYGPGTVFELTPTKEGWTETILHSFDNNGTDGWSLYAGVVFDKKGNLYGTTQVGGTGSCEYGCGTVFKVTP